MFFGWVVFEYEDQCKKEKVSGYDDFQKGELEFCFFIYIDRQEVDSYEEYEIDDNLDGWMDVIWLIIDDNDYSIEFVCDNYFE